ncbi:methylthioribose-1-phosphate isomerase [Lysobacter arseniciresistens ZS79]|uniref:Methylthioribose-1-phosphate isomerase n=1 Tax=Lysobacter arseniciresistens ZS79 TaxID=913325 RepID=A0A0A0F7B5_9GAMM|nr:S-methyl-5-thioribose-1-phosphate isomerase [Lysobacter arseniciresistens]KGM57262.1 methylthioribose-1-phosphate isomerase [Lysobacter arseniciresistens ZS79]
MNDTAFDFDRYDRIRPIRWTGDALELLDQRKLPFEVGYVRCDSSEAVADAIRALTVRGAPAIGIAAAWGLVLAARSVDAADGAEAAAKLQPAIDHLNAARPTAVNLAWALARMRRVLVSAGSDWRDVIEAEARAIADEDLAANRRMGALGAALIEPGSNVLTHCNTGSLATAGFGTALGVIRAGVAQGRIDEVFAGETRPWLQGARLTVWELQQDGIAPTLIADAAASHLMKSGRVQWVVVGADRICANGDVANKIGTYQLAIAARHHGVKFMVAAPSSTVDMDTPSGELIHIEERDPGELFGIGGNRTAADGVGAWNPVFDVTPHDLVDAIVTERGVIENPDAGAMREAFGG